MTKLAFQISCFCYLTVIKLWYSKMICFYDVPFVILVAKITWHVILCFNLSRTSNISLSILFVVVNSNEIANFLETWIHDVRTWLKSYHNLSNSLLTQIWWAWWGLYIEISLAQRKSYLIFCPFIAFIIHHIIFKVQSDSRKVVNVRPVVNILTVKPSSLSVDRSGRGLQGWGFCAVQACNE